MGYLLDRVQPGRCHPFANREKDIVAKKLWEQNIDQLIRFLRDGQATWRSFEIVNNSCHFNARKYLRLQRACNDVDTIFHPPNTSGGTIVVDAYLEGVPRVTGEPMLKNLKTIQRLLNTNAMRISSYEGGGGHGHLCIITMNEA
jgi:hypothetical protein